MIAAPSPFFRRYPIMSWYDAPIPGICMQVQAIGRQRPCQNVDDIVGGGRCMRARHYIIRSLMMLRLKRPVSVTEWLIFCIHSCDMIIIWLTFDCYHRFVAFFRAAKKKRVEEERVAKEWVISLMMIWYYYIYFVFYALTISSMVVNSA